MVKKFIGDILVSLNSIDQKTVDTEIAANNVHPEKIGEILLEKGLINKTSFAQALAKQSNLPYVEKITEQMADLSLLNKFPLRFLRQNSIIPIFYEGNVTIITADPRNVQLFDDVTLLLGSQVKTAVAKDDIIMDAINKYYPLEGSKEMMEELKEDDDDEFDLHSIEGKDIMEMANDAPIVKLVNHTIFQAVKEDASDIHIEPFEKELRIRYRIDGIMYQKLLPPKRYQGAIVSRIKIMANLNIAEKRKPQDGRIQIKIADKAIDLRISVLPCNFGERVVMRILDKSKNASELEKLNLSEYNYETLIRNIERPNGIILVSGPTGSGKTSSLYAILNRLNQPDVNLITVEDPVEYTITGISQVQVNEKVGLTFASALRSILRQDPDVVLIGEIRDGETAQIATQAALTGHLVLSTIHTNSAPATITRLIDMGIEPFLIASSLVLVISQRLIRKLCNICKKAYKPDAAMLARIGLTPQQTTGITFYEPGDCDECLNTGYKGRMAVFEVMEISDEIKKLIIQRVDASIIKQQAMAQGMKLLSEDGIRCIIDGTTTIAEVLSVAYVEDEKDASSQAEKVEKE
ncbi:type II secretion system ATPase GspE [Candidatus Babeliales bacterium]|nr:type II secretion system ATPase GspE [Candidatus Babeliales bacterium]